MCRPGGRTDPRGGRPDTYRIIGPWPISFKGLIDGRVTPTNYSGVYRVEGKRKVGTGLRKAGTRTERVFISTHLDEAHIKSLLDATGTKIEMPDHSMRGQWVSVISTLIIGGVVVFMFMFQ